jgi:hypothetical protein
MTEQKTDIRVSDVAVGDVQTVETKKEKTAVVVRRVSSKTVADDMTSRIMGKLIGFDDIYDPTTQTFLTEAELRAKGAIFVTVTMNQVMTPGKNGVTKKSRTTKIPTPFIRKTNRVQYIANVNWGSFINRRGHGDFVPDEERANGTENYNGCKAISVKGENYYIAGVAFRTIESTKYVDRHGVELDKATIEAEYMPKRSQASKEREAQKHGIAVEFDPQFRTTRIDNCSSVRAFGFDYQPTDNR